MRRAGAVICLCAVGLLLGACSPGATPTTVHEDHFGDWQLASMSRDGAAVDLKDSATTLVISEGHYVGKAPCNNYGGPITSDSDHPFEQLGNTEMLCPEVDSIESSYFEALRTTDRVDLSEGSLILTGPSLELRYERNAASM